MTAAAFPPSLAEEVARKFRRIMQKHYRAHSPGTNVNPETLLTTDYLNHFSEMVMMLELMQSAPEEFFIYLMAWEPKSYEEHFRTSGFPEKDLAIAAYRHAPENVRSAFDAVIRELEQQAVQALRDIRRLAEEGRPNALAQHCEEVAPALRNLIDKAARLVNSGVTESHSLDDQKGEDQTARQKDIDAMFG